MTTEEQILERLDRIEAQLAPVSASARGLNELREDLIPLSGQAFRLLIRELEEGAQLFVDDNRGIRDLLDRGSDLLKGLAAETDDGELASLADDLHTDGAGGESSHRPADLMAETNRLRD